MKSSFVLIAFLLVLSIISTVSAAGNYTSTFSSNDVVRVNQSLVQDPTGGAATPWETWLLSGLIGTFFVVLTLLKPKLYRMDYEITIILSVIAWPFFWYWTWGCLTSIDRVIGVGMTSANGTAMMITQHILYTFPTLGYIGVGVDVAAVILSMIMVAQFKMFKENEEKEKPKPE